MYLDVSVAGCAEPSAQPESARVRDADEARRDALAQVEPAPSGIAQLKEDIDGRLLGGREPDAGASHPPGCGVLGHKSRGGARARAAGT